MGRSMFISRMLRKMADDGDWFHQTQARLLGAVDWLKQQCETAKRSYVDFMASDPPTASRIEGAIRTASYLIPGRFSASEEISELGETKHSFSGVYCLSSW